MPQPDPSQLFLFSHAEINCAIPPFAFAMGRALLFGPSEKGSPFLSQKTTASILGPLLTERAPFHGSACQLGGLGVHLEVQILGRPHGGLCPIGSLGLPQDGFDVHLYRGLCQPKIPCNEFV
jgi:hypothetical protein